jgi:hypothetical protein
MILITSYGSFSKNCPSHTCSTTGKFQNNTTRNAHEYYNWKGHWHLIWLQYLHDEVRKNKLKRKNIQTMKVIIRKFYDSFQFMLTPILVRKLGVIMSNETLIWILKLDLKIGSEMLYNYWTKETVYSWKLIKVPLIHISSHKNVVAEFVIEWILAIDYFAHGSGFNPHEQEFLKDQKLVRKWTHILSHD